MSHMSSLEQVKRAADAKYVAYAEAKAREIEELKQSLICIEADCLDKFKHISKQLERLIKDQADSKDRSGDIEKTLALIQEKQTTLEVSIHALAGRINKIETTETDLSERIKSARRKSK